MLVSISSMPAENDIVNYTKQIENFADFLHLDICDGKYNNTKCFSPELAHQINSISTIPLDCHLMTKTPLKYAEQYIKSGANFVTAQFESFENSEQVLEFIDFVKSKNCLCGLALEIETSVDKISGYLDSLDIVLLMSVKTGKSGQTFDETVFEKVKALKDIKQSKNQNFKIQVDGGINDSVAKKLKEIGVDIVVSGNFVYKAQNKQLAIESLK